MKPRATSLSVHTDQSCTHRGPEQRLRNLQVQHSRAAWCRFLNLVYTHACAVPQLAVGVLSLLFSKDLQQRDVFSSDTDAFQSARVCGKHEGTERGIARPCKA